MMNHKRSLPQQGNYYVVPYMYARTKTHVCHHVRKLYNFNRIAVRTARAWYKAPDARTLHLYAHARFTRAHTFVVGEKVKIANIIIINK
jgi:hypothetical protein